MIFFANLIHLLLQIYTLLVVVKVLLSYFMSPFHPIRQGIDRLVDPLLEPIRRNVPPLGMFDFSPLILIVAIQIVDSLLMRIFYSLY
ncbi:MAG: YggT family protein [Anaerolineales bacterium]